MQFDGVGSEQGGIRPGVIFQNNKGNTHSPNIIALPLSSSMKKMGMPTHVLLRAHQHGLAKDSIVLCENPQRMSKERILHKITHLSDGAMREIAKASLLASAVLSFLSLEDIEAIREQSIRLNGF